MKTYCDRLHNITADQCTTFFGSCVPERIRRRWRSNSFQIAGPRLGNTVI